MERAFAWLRARGYPPQGVDWLRRHRLLILLLLAMLAWLPVFGLAWIILALLG